MRPYRMPVVEASEPSTEQSSDLGQEVASCRDEAMLRTIAVAVVGLIACGLLAAQLVPEGWQLLCLLVTIALAAVALSVASIGVTTVSRHERGVRIYARRSQPRDVRFDEVQELSFARRLLPWPRIVLTLDDGSRVTLPLAIARDVLFKVVEPILDRARIWVNSPEPVDLGALTVGRAGVHVCGDEPLRWQDIRQVRWGERALVFVSRHREVRVRYGGIRRLRMLTAMLVARVRVHWTEEE